MKSELTQAQRKRIRMINYWAFLVAAFLSLIFAVVVAVKSWWMPVLFLGFSGWLFRLMNLTGFKETPDSKFSLPEKLLTMLTKEKQKNGSEPETG
jgi:membrane associated rhomboid family serine protease